MGKALSVELSSTWTGLVFSVVFRPVSISKGNKSVMLIKKIQLNLSTTQQSNCNHGLLNSVVRGSAIPTEFKISGVSRMIL